MKFKIGQAIGYIFNDKKLLGKIFAISFLIVLAAIFFACKNFYISCLYFDNLSERISYTTNSFTPDLAIPFLGFPFCNIFTIFFDIAKIFIAGLSSFHLCAIGCILPVLVIISYIFGYYISNTHNRIFNNEYTLKGNFIQYFKNGIKFLFGCLVLSLPLIIIGLFLYKEINPYLNGLNIKNENILWLVQYIKHGFSNLFLFLGAIILYLYLSCATIPFVCNFKLKSIFKFKDTFENIFRSFKSYTKYIVFLTLANFGLLFVIKLARTISDIMADFIPKVVYNTLSVQKYISNDDFNFFIVNLIAIVLISPVVFWIFSIISDIQAQYAIYLLETNENAELKKIKKKSKKSKLFLILLILLLILAIGALVYIKLVFKNSF